MRWNICKWTGNETITVILRFFDTYFICIFQEKSEKLTLLSVEKNIHAGYTCIWEHLSVHRSIPVMRCVRMCMRLSAQDEHVCVYFYVRVWMTGMSGSPCHDKVYRSVCQRPGKRLICLMPAPLLTPSLACPASRPSPLPLLSGLEECTKGQSIPRTQTDLQ